MAFINSYAISDDFDRLDQFESLDITLQNDDQEREIDELLNDPMFSQTFLHQYKEQAEEDKFGSNE